MARKHLPRDEEASDEPMDLRALLKELAIALIIVGAVFGAIFGYTQTYPPIVVVESASMQHSHDTSYVGVIDTGDMVLVQAARARSDIVTWVEGRVTSYSTYGDYGDVIIFQKPGSLPGSVPVIHRAILYVRPSGTDAFDVPDLVNFPAGEWEGVNRTGGSATEPFDLAQVTIHGMGWQHDLGITFDLAAFAQNPTNRREGFLTMGDNNAYDSCSVGRDPCEPFPPYDQSWVVPLGNVLGRARGEVPWLGLVKLTFQPTLIRLIGAIVGVAIGVMLPRTNRSVVLVGTAVVGGILGYFIAGLFDPVPPTGGACCSEWGDDLAPRNSWDSLLIALPLLFASPFIAEGAIWAWNRYAAPWFRERFHREEEEPTDPPGSR